MCTSAYPFGDKRRDVVCVGAVLDLAMNDSVIKNAFPPWLSVEWMKYDVTDCDAAYAVISAIDAYNDCAHVFFGPSCDFALGKLSFSFKSLTANRKLLKGNPPLTWVTGGHRGVQSVKISMIFQRHIKLFAFIMFDM
uniref:SFRICE_040157 n=1 Tax=Spodoptera frugiperda TaxID=7108 RepID=A0A2H1VVB9_SPOFR